ncbi:MAG: hypothetical protein ACLFT0_05485 [Spirulinaceae cyanobacterium]
MNEIRFPYRPKMGLLTFAAIFFGICGAVLMQKAMSNDRELILNGVIEFSTGSATIFYWVLSLISFAFVVIAVLTMYKGLTTNREIVLGEYSFTCPKNALTSNILNINYHEITDIKIQTINSNKFLVVYFRGGSVTIPRNMLPNKKAFEDLTQLLVARIQTKSAGY